MPGAFRLVAVPVEAGGGLEVGGEHDRPFRAGDRGDRGVHRPLGLDRFPPCRCVAVVDDDVGDTDGVAYLGEEGEVRLAAAFHNRDRLAVGVVPEPLEDEGEHELLRSSLDEEHGPGEEELATLGVDLADRTEAFPGR